MKSPFMKKVIVLMLVLLITPLLLGACAASGENPVPEGILHFFAGFTAQQIAGYIIAFVVGVLGVQINLFQWVKVKFGWRDVYAMLLVYVVGWVITFVLMLLTGTLNLADYDFTLASITGLANTVFLGSQVWYQVLGERAPEKVKSINA
ncbi:MAG: hypothetical protein DWQ07_14230 [Chloroflexi bacterium]|nr:MAG: hypothetical protein DWQ07_14230 [Chloroflexota bacterium]MBL1195759.1 hypothetical protein [Chloroflexota bacterium]NOH13048.1 hypothetical protein [Chloroflexota bacterium]